MPGSALVADRGNTQWRCKSGAEMSTQGKTGCTQKRRAKAKTGVDCAVWRHAGNGRKKQGDCVRKGCAGRYRRDGRKQGNGD